MTSIDETEGLHPDALKVLADYLIGEVIAVICERRPDGRLAARVRFYDAEARGLNEDPDEPDHDHQEYFSHYYFLSADGSRVIEIRDAHDVLIEKNPAPWHLQEAVSARPGAPGRRSRVSGLAARVG